MDFLVLLSFIVIAAQAKEKTNSFTSIKFQEVNEVIEGAELLRKSTDSRVKFTPVVKPWNTNHLLISCDKLVEGCGGVIDNV